MAKTLSITATFTRPEKVKLALKLKSKQFREVVQKGLEREGSVIQARAKEILKNVNWVTRGRLVRGRGTSNEKVYPPGTPMVGHIDTSDLWKSIDIKAEVSRDGFAVYVGTNKEYALHVELLPDGGYLLPALLEKRHQVIANIRKGLLAIVNRRS